ncbi:MAG: SMC-Scp complex subunit ScpB [Alphaproteobacteria bacterium]
MQETELKNIIEAVLFAADEPLSLKRLQSLFPEQGNPGSEVLKQTIAQLQEDYAGRPVELKEVGSGYRFQVRQAYAEWVSKLWEERPPRYSRATLETLALIAYRQPITRGEIEEVRGVSVSSQIIRTLLERDWIKVVGHRDVPGKPALYATTRTFLDYFNLKSLDELPSLAELRDIDAINAELELSLPEAADTAVEETAAGEEQTGSESPATPGIESNSEPAEANTLSAASPDDNTAIQEPAGVET